MAITGLTDEMYAGNRRKLRFTVIDEDTPPFTNPKDLTNLTLKFSLARLSPDGIPLTQSPLVDLNSNGAQVVIVDAPNGVVEVTLLFADTAGITTGPDVDVYFELEAYDTFGNGVVVATGTLTVKPNVVNA